MRNEADLRADINWIEKVDALYSTQVVEDYKGNPLIEALPPILQEDDVIEQISVFPPYNEKERSLDSSYRYHCVQRLFQYFQPFEKHLDLEQRLSRAIRQGYLHRNPMKKESVMRTHESYRAIKEGKFLKNYRTGEIQTATGFTIIGLSGIGKSTAIDRVLSFYPQIIAHQEYDGTPFTFTQVVWMKLDCPFDGSLKGLCTSFFTDLDRLLGTNYLNKFGSKQNTLDLMLQRIAHLSKLHGIGILIIDEIQHLNLSKSGGSDKMLNFFVTLVNTIGVPVLMVGTNKATSVLQGEFRQARRGSGQGDMVWNQMPKDETWNLFIEGMWEYQWTSKYTPLTQQLNDLIYDESQGILDIAVKLFMLSQVKAISLGKDKIGVQLIKRASEESLKLVKPMIKALRSGIPSEISKYEDIRPIDMEEELEKYAASVDLQDKIRVQKKLQANKQRKKEQTIMEEVTLQLLGMDFEADHIQVAVRKTLKRYGENVEKSLIVKQAFKLLMEKDERKERVSRKETKNTPTREYYLINQMKEARRQKESVYVHFLKERIIKPPMEDVVEGDGYANMVSNSLS
ncbi:ATP-binding protein [Bacillus sp. N1-1]|uniref:ATP-binding protein n=1 Tax=Bacillus sp. N1-1 TaxID=2682541 RepID=UPI0013164810|nr:ATP-binding protein [Bacillus sp. N1-1]QHA90172.1 AAA family ATPase [Bacillus sp. N1-1]